MLLDAPASEALFPQCPPVDLDTGCQFLITVTDAGSTVAEDPSQRPYEGEDDALIGVQNSSSRAIAALPLSASGLFSFEQDGMCDPGSPPVPSGCGLGACPLRRGRVCVPPPRPRPPPVAPRFQVRAAPPAGGGGGPPPLPPRRGVTPPTTPTPPRRAPRRGRTAIARTAMRAPPP